MPTIIISFNNPLNTSVQKGDIAYFSNPVDVGPSKIYQSTKTPHKTNTQQEIKKIGVIIDLAPSIGSFIQCFMPQNLFNAYFASMSTNSFIMFSKDNKVNMSSILGYYASVQFRNNSLDEAELFNVGVDIFESSK
jgi:hypothetical protein